MKLKVTVGDWNYTVKGLRVALYYNPEAHEVYTCWSLGAGSMSQAFRRVHRLIGEVPVTVAPGELRQWIRTRESGFDRLRALYLGPEKIEGKYIGQWTSEGDDLVEELMRGLVRTPWQMQPRTTPDSGILDPAHEELSKAG